ncbi:acetolactate synthase large subunit [Bordetella sp. 15P40C-2]|uniref:acetolactate synthase large subunit n=1 Tax=Bordetella sp. 15P40C-2 TaxID=2572246 RepID=UPI0013291593|nr:acetolactate synthase large subunit [Bordetella sp. 15P40C-2]MVW72934.1 acetolactate synthase large subunit [Bordetella sp. 15P40C-2]
MNGSEAMVRTLLNHGVSVCFANPGTSEMHFVSALDRLPQMRCVLGLFEGVVTGAADGYYRMTRRPAATLLHLGSGLGNGIANLHNAKRARSGIVNIIGEHAQDHIANDAPLTSDIQVLARPVSHWVRTCASAVTAPADTAEAVRVASGSPGRVASLILPANASWEDSPAGAVERTYGTRPSPCTASSVVDDVAKALRAAQVRPDQMALLLGGRAMLGEGPRLAAQIAARVGCKLYAETKNARSLRGAGRVNIPQIPYPLNGALEALDDIRLLVLVDAVAPVAFFGYPGKPRFLTHPECRIETLVSAEEDVESALQALSDAVGGKPGELVYVSDGTQRLAWDAQARPNSQDMGRVLAALLPENAIVVDEAITTGRQLQSGAAAGRPHDWLEITGGAIGYGLPCATGAAVASPGRKVVAIIGDGSAMYTLQSLWTMAREGLDVTVVICANRKYQILQGELAAMGGPPPAANATRMLSLEQPHLDWVKLAEGQGVSGKRVDNMDAFAKALAAGLASGGPNLIEVLL